MKGRCITITSKPVAMQCILQIAGSKQLKHCKIQTKDPISHANYLEVSKSILKDFHHVIKKHVVNIY